MIKLKFYLVIKLWGLFRMKREVMFISPSFTRMVQAGWWSKFIITCHFSYHTLYQPSFKYHPLRLTALGLIKGMIWKCHVIIYLYIYIATNKGQLPLWGLGFLYFNTYRWTKNSKKWWTTNKSTQNKGNYNNSYNQTETEEQIMTVRSVASNVLLMEPIAEPSFPNSVNGTTRNYHIKCNILFIIQHMYVIMFWITGALQNHMNSVNCLWDGHITIIMRKEIIL